MSTFRSPYSPDSALHETVKALLSRPLPSLVPKAPWNAEITKEIEQASAAESTSAFVTAVLHLLNDDLDRAHQLVQAREGNPTADYLHMLVHRREGDWSNTGYWIRRAGKHPIYDMLSTTIRTETDDPTIKGLVSEAEPWNPTRMLELCRQASSGKPDRETADAVSRLSTLEIAAALDWCVQNPEEAMSAR
ncbi:MAG: hypothetical protein V4671_25430 [Armatimonadota bacterium]